jgi:hypothetical protein
MARHAFGPDQFPRLPQISCMCAILNISNAINEFTTTSSIKVCVYLRQGVLKIKYNFGRGHANNGRGPLFYCPRISRSVR